jgi:hypothetical protein
MSANHATFLVVVSNFSFGPVITIARIFSSSLQRILLYSDYGAIVFATDQVKPGGDVMNLQRIMILALTQVFPENLSTYQSKV